MNFRHSTTDKPEKLNNTQILALQWESIDWVQVEQDVNRLQSRIAKTTAQGNKNRVKRLQYLLTHSFHAKAYAVKKVTSNKGKKHFWSRQNAMVNPSIKNESSSNACEQEVQSKTP